jgi:peptidoglycan/LPS O-acetylase OafA/YrhL
MLYHFGLNAPGNLSVTMFFVLSGFLITWLLLKEERAAGSVSLAGFYARRTLRIFPAYYVFVVASVAADRLLDDPWTPGQVAAALTYTLNYYNAFLGHDTTPAAHAWSLAVEEQFYVLWPLAFLLLARRGRRALAAALAAAVVAAAAWRSCLFLRVGVPTHYVYNAFDTRFDSLAIGCLMAVLGSRREFLGFARAVAWRPWLPALTLAALAWSRLATPAAYAYTLGYTVDSLLLAVLMLQVMQLHRSRAWSWLEWRPMRYLGAVSYPMYLWHGWAITAGRHVEVVPPAARLLIGIGVCVAVASLSYYVVEKPILALRPRVERWLRARGPLLPARVRPAIGTEGG